jgi:hypothetical protein
MNSAADHLYGTYMGHMTYMGPSGADNAVPSLKLSCFWDADLGHLETASERPKVTLYREQKRPTIEAKETYYRGKLGPPQVTLLLLRGVAVYLPEIHVI